jgi:parvulin-like peptidyl-prolyl isomerase
MTVSNESPARTTSASRPIALLIAGGAIGIALAATGLLTAQGDQHALPPNAVATVNGQPISAQEYGRVVEALAEDRRSGVDDEQRRFVLKRLIEEELLIQRGLELGLAQHDSRVRKDLTAAVIDSVVAEVNDLRPDTAELRRFYDENRELFASSGQLRVRQVWFSVADPAQAGAALERARQSADRLRNGDDFATVRADLGDREIAPLPDALVPLVKLSDYLGPTAVRTLQAMKVGDVSDPVRSGTGYNVLQLVDSRPGDPPAFEDIEALVLNEYRRRAADEALRRYLDDLRERADIVTAGELP